MPTSTRPILHLICQAHLDPVWLWPRRDGVAETLTTLQSAVDRLAEDPALRFSQCSMAFYRWVEDQDPRLFAEIRRLIAAGRWEVIGPWEVQPDCNLPSAESFLRHAESGAAYAREHLGVVPDILWNPDSFGHSAGLPTLLAATGIKRYVMMRPSAWESDRPLPNLFWWAGAGAARVLTWRIPAAYGQSPAWGAREIQDWIRRTWREHIPTGLQHGCCFIGVGNHGGGPTKVHLQALRDLSADPDLPELRFSTLAEFFAAVENTPDLPVISGELQRHAPGCYPLHAGIKQAHRAAEGALLRAEAMADLAGITVDLAEPWRHLLFNQFHDILAGTCVASGCQEAVADLGGIASAGERSVERAVGRIARRIDTRGAAGGVLTVINALPWARTATVAFDTFRAPDGGAHLRSWVGADGQSRPLQWLPAEAHFGPFGLPWGRLVAALPVSASGWSSGELVATAVAASSEVAPVQPVMRSFGLLPPGWAQPLTVRVLADDCDTWGHGAQRWDRELEAITPTGHRVVASGPVVAVTRATGRFRASRVVLEAWRWAHEPDMIEVRIAWEGRDARLAVAVELPTDPAETVRCGVAGAVIERPADGRMASHQDWLAFGGVQVFPEACAAHDAVSGRLRLHLLRTALFAEHDPFPAQNDDGHAEHIDAGWSHHRLLVRRGQHSDDAAYRRAAELRFHAERFTDSAHPGDLPRHGSGAPVTDGLAFWSRRARQARGLDLVTGAVVVHPLGSGPA